MLFKDRVNNKLWIMSFGHHAECNQSVCLPFIGLSVGRHVTINCGGLPCCSLFYVSPFKYN